MPNKTSSMDSSPTYTKSFSLSIDTWAVLVALALAIAVRFDLIKRVPW